MNILDDEFLKQGLKQINDSVQYLSATIDDFRNFYKTDKNKQTFKIQETIDKVINIVNPQFKFHRIEIIQNIEDISIISYENELIQVMINLLNNSKDELIKKDSDFEKLIFIDVIKNEEKISIIVKDNAGGISEDIINRVFEPYFTTKNQSKGTGIRLYMSREIICKSMNGEISTRNTTFKQNGQTCSGALFEILLQTDLL